MENETHTSTDNKPAGSADSQVPASGFTPEKDRKLIGISCLMLAIVTVVVILMVGYKVRELKDVSGVNLQVYMTDKEEIRNQSIPVSAAEIMEDPQSHLEKWISSEGTVRYMHDKRGEEISRETAVEKMGCVYWLAEGLPVTSVRTELPAVNEGGRIRVYGQLAYTDVSSLEFSDDTAEVIMDLFNPDQEGKIPIFFASEVIAVTGSPLNEEVDNVGSISSGGDE